jgi:membrane protease YdiL (CAAX protease family)
MINQHSPHTKNERKIFKFWLGPVLLYLVMLLIVAVTPGWVAYGSSTAVKMALTILPYLLLTAAVLLACRLEGLPLQATLGLSAAPLKRQLKAAWLPFAISVGAFVVAPLLLGFPAEDVLSFKARNWGILVFYLFYTQICVGFGEEIIFRGYYYERLRIGLGSDLAAVLLSSLLFGLFHYPNGHNWAQVLVTTLIGLIYATARWKMKDCSTLSTGLAHGLHDNVIRVLSMFLR